jgi:hypothetical protein
MHSTSRGPSLGERGSELPRMPWALRPQLRRLRWLQLSFLFIPFILFVFFVWGRRERSQQ